VIFETFSISQSIVAMSLRCGGLCSDCRKFCVEFTSEIFLKIDQYFAKISTWVGCLVFFYSECIYTIFTSYMLKHMLKLKY